MNLKTIQQKLDEGRQYRKVAEIRADEDMIVEGYATTFDQPYELFADGNYVVREQVDRHAFDEADMSDVILQFDHAGRVFARTSNGTLTLGADDHGLKIRADLGGTAIGRELFEEIKGGYTNKMSFGFTVAEDEQTVTEDKETGTVEVLRTIKRIGKLYDVSAVSIPANNATEISARSYGEGVIAELAEEFRLREERKQKIRIMLNL